MKQNKTNTVVIEKTAKRHKAMLFVSGSIIVFGGMVGMLLLGQGKQKESVFWFALAFLGIILRTITKAKIWWDHG